MSQFVSSIITLKDSNYLSGSWYVGLAVMITGTCDLLFQLLNYLIFPLQVRVHIILICVT